MQGLLVLAMVQWGFLTAMIARGKKRDPALWFVLGAVLPVIGMFVALVVSTPRRRVPLVERARALLPRRRRSVPAPVPALQS